LFELEGITWNILASYIFFILLLPFLLECR